MIRRLPIIYLKRFVISPLFVLITHALATGQVADFRFGPSGKTTVALSNQSVFEATINGKGPFKFLFDTGANVNILNPEVISQLGLTPTDNHADIRGISGGKLDVKPYRADEVRIGDLTLTDQTFFNVPIPLPGIAGAIGYELMSRVVVKADNEHQQLILYDPASFTYNGSGEKLELLPQTLGLIVHARVSKALGDFVLDTGAIGVIGVAVNHRFTQQHHLLHTSFLFYLFHSSLHGVFSGGADGNAPAATLERIKSLCLGTMCVPHIVGEFSDGNTSQYAGTIPNEILRRFIFTIDWQHQAIYVEKTSRWNELDIYNQTGLQLDLEDNGSALVISAVFSHSPASKAHIKVGDRIVLIDNHPPAPTWYSDDPALLQRAGTVVKLTIQRGNTSRQIDLKLNDIL